MKTLKDFNNYYSKNYNKWLKKYTPYCKKNTPQDILSQIYEKLVENNKYSEIKDINGYVKVFFFNKEKRFHRDNLKNNYVTKFTNLQIVTFSHLFSNGDSTYFDEIIEDDNEYTYILLDALNEVVSTKLTVDEKELFYLLYQSQNGKGMNVKQVAIAYGYNYSTLQKVSKPLKIKIKNEILNILTLKGWNKQWLQKVKEYGKY